MSNKIKTGVVFTGKFILPQAGGPVKVFRQFVDYVDRTDTWQQQNGYSAHNDYMDDQQKTTALFSAAYDELNDAQRKEMKGLFDQAQKRQYFVARCAQLRSRMVEKTWHIE